MEEGKCSGALPICLGPTYTFKIPGQVTEGEIQAGNQGDKCVITEGGLEEGTFKGEA